MSAHTSDSRQRRSKRYLALHEQLRREVEADRYRPRPIRHKIEAQEYRQTGDSCRI